MHPEVASADPGACPICGMALTPTRTVNGPVDEVVLTMPPRPPTAHHAATDTVRRVTLSAPAHLAAFVDDAGRAVALMDEQQIASMDANEEGTFVRASAPPIAAKRASARPERWDDGTLARDLRSRRASRGRR